MYFSEKKQTQVDEVGEQELWIFNHLVFDKFLEMFLLIQCTNFRLMIFCLGIVFATSLAQLDETGQ